MEQQSDIGTIPQKEYLHRETGQYVEGQGHHDSQMKHFCRWYSSKSIQCLGFLLHIQKINWERKPYNDFWVKRSKVNLPPTYWLHFISDRKSLRLLITDTSNFVKIWRMMIGRHSEHQRTKTLLSRSVTHAFRLSVVSIHFLANCASVSAPYMRFIIKVRWTFYVLEYSLSITSIILHTNHPKGDISCKSCNSVKSTYRSFASLNLVQIRQFF